MDEDLGVSSHEFVDTLVFVGVPVDFRVVEFGVEDFVVFVEERAHVLGFIDKDVSDVGGCDFASRCFLYHADEVDVVVFIAPFGVVAQHSLHNWRFTGVLEEIFWILAGEASEVDGFPDGFVHAVPVALHKLCVWVVVIRVIPGVEFPAVLFLKLFLLAPGDEGEIVADVPPGD